MKKAFPVRLLCKLMKVSESAYYAWFSRPVASLCQESEAIENRVILLFSESKSSIGSRKISKQLKKEGSGVGRYRVRTLMRKNHLVVKRKRPFVITTESQHNNPVAENLLNRQFNPAEPNQVWSTDISYLKSKSGWLYLAVVLDLHSRQVIGWSVSHRITTDLCKHALQMAYWKRKPPKGLIHHSDRGSQYTSAEYQKLLKHFKMTCSMSRKGNCWDNSPTERFFKSLKDERMNWVMLSGLKQVREEVVDYITWYNSKRLHASLDYNAPFEYEALFYKNAA